MNSRERVKRAIHFGRPDKVPIRHLAMNAALHEHGRKLINLWRKFPGDFGEDTVNKIPHPEPEDIAPDGSYHRIEKDAWGVEWEYVRFGIHGHPRSRPLDDWRQLDSFKAPPVSELSGSTFDNAARQISEHKRKWYSLLGWISIFEILHAVRRFDDVLVDLIDDSPEINRLADIVVEYQQAMIDYYIAVGADGIMFGDDWGTQISPIINPALWRKFFRPRYARIMEPIRKAGVDIFFHSCGHILPLFDDLADLGINVIWPQLGNNDNKILAAKCWQRKICIELHMDRQQLMSFSSAVEIDRAVAGAKRTFGDVNGGVIYHAEIDNDFAFERVEALIMAFQKFA